MIQTVSAYEARTRLGELINLVYYQNAEVVIERMGKPVVKLVAVTKSAKKTKTLADKIKKYTGIWNNKDGDLIEKYAMELRRTAKILP